MNFCGVQKTTIFTDRFKKEIMKKYILILFVFLMGYSLSAQEINCVVNIDAQQTGKTQLSIFRTLQGAIEDFLNTTNWNSNNLPREQRVEASFFITFHDYNENTFRGSIQVQSSRPVYGSSLVTPVFNFMDRSFNFTYEEGQPLVFNQNSFDSNLASILSFYVYVILGMDADTFALDGGSNLFAQANQIANVAQQSGGSGWGAAAGGNSRYELGNQLTSSNYRDYHEALYVYHRHGLDLMGLNVEEGKYNVMEAIGMLAKVNRTRPNTALVRSFFDAKSFEVAAIFRDGPPLDTTEMVKDLNNMAPTYSQEWRTIR